MSATVFSLIAKHDAWFFLILGAEANEFHKLVFSKKPKDRTLLICYGELKLAFSVGLKKNGQAKRK